MLGDFLSYIKQDLSIDKTQKLLLAISGGIDSMVMLHLFRVSGYDIYVAHVNHSTRNGDSDKDMKFVKEYCKKHKIGYYDITLDYDKMSSGNFQQNARKERYSFFNKLIKEHKIDFLATAHHMEDRWETFVMHLNRKSGIKGLTSLAPKTENIIRPLMLFNKLQITQYAAIEGILYVEDSSNAQDDYKRNEIRHHVTPALVEIFPDYVSQVNSSIVHLSKTVNLISELVEKQDLYSFHPPTGHMYIRIDKIREYNNALDLLYFIISDYAFDYPTTLNILKASKTGSIFLSQSHECLYDRETLIIREFTTTDSIHLEISSPGTYSLADGRTLDICIQSCVRKNESNLLLDEEKINWPIIIRTILPGDRFKPVGMDGKTKTLKKLFTDIKMNRFSKESQLVATVNDEIVLVLDIRAADGYTAQEDSSNILIKLSR